MEKLFFSIIVPAHNEATCIEETLEHLKKLDYPAGKFEVIVVENGSTDNTLELAKKIEGGNFKVLQSAKGVSRAKNVGADNAKKESDWLIFLDADTLLLPTFLSELDAFLRRKDNRFTVGAVSVRPLPDSLQAKIWFGLYNLSRSFTKTSQALKILRRKLFPPVRFNEQLVDGEDIDVIQQARRYGKFFFLRTRSALTSTRRFEKLGWWYMCFYWTFGAVLPAAWRHRLEYDVVR